MDRARSIDIPGLCISCFGRFRPQQNPGNLQAGRLTWFLSGTAPSPLDRLDSAIHKCAIPSSAIPNCTVLGITRQRQVRRKNDVNTFPLALMPWLLCCILGAKAGSRSARLGRPPANATATAVSCGNKKIPGILMSRAIARALTPPTCPALPAPSASLAWRPGILRVVGRPCAQASGPSLRWRGAGRPECGTPCTPVIRNAKAARQPRASPRNAERSARLPSAGADGERGPHPKTFPS
jgi:hypothetical protein